MTDDDSHLMNAHHDCLQQEFADIWTEISNVMGGNAPAGIGDKLDGIVNGVIGYEEALLDAIRRRDAEIAALRRKADGQAEQADPTSIEVTEFEVDGMLHRISMCLVDIINLCEPSKDKREEFDNLSFSILGEIEDLKARFHEQDEGAEN